MRMSYDVAVVGGGFYGLRIATLCASMGRSTLLLEREPVFASRASFHNQARVHGGYHYPRSILTAVRARRNYARFIGDFEPAIERGFTHVYAIARQQSKVGAREFFEFCRRIEAPLSPAPKDLARRFDSDSVEQAFVAEEFAFHPGVLADLALVHASRAGVECVPDTNGLAVAPGGERRLSLDVARADGSRARLSVDHVFNATYSGLNGMLAQSGIGTLPLVHEITEIALVQTPPSMQFHGVTVMDGPFWSCLPFPPARGMHSLTHVRFTPHARWSSGEPSELSPDAPVRSLARASHALLMRRDAARFFPEMREAMHMGSLWEVKTVLPRSAGDDGRPILVHRHADAPGLCSILGAKIDGVYDAEDEIRELMEEGH
jgi:glycine/D-amino acid oxidase-like deaminating enzyme